MKTSMTIALLLASTATPALAETPDDIVVTASRIVQEPREVGSALTVVTAEQLKQGQILFVKDRIWPASRFPPTAPATAPMSPCAAPTMIRCCG